MNDMTTQATQEVEQVRPIEVITAEVQLQKQYAGGAILEIGRLLIEAKAQLQHGEWLPWLENEVQFSESTAQRFMRLAKGYSKSVTVTDLGASKALVLLALPESEREEFVAEKHLVNGVEKSVAEMSGAELKEAIRERDEARKEAAYWQKETEDARRDMNEQLEEQRTVYDVDLAAAQEKLAAAQDQEQKLTDELHRAKNAIRELENRPVEVAVEKVVDKDAVAEAVAKTREELAGEALALQQAKEQAERDTAKAREELEKARKQQEEAMAQLETAQKKLSVAGSPEIAAFKVHFGQVQTAVDEMRGCIEKMEASGDKEGGAKLRRALLALAEKVKEEMA